MQNTEKLSITLPADIAQMVREKVEGGDSASDSEVVREALRYWQEREALKAERLKIIRNKIAESIEDPRPAIPATEVNKRLRPGTRPGRNCEPPDNHSLSRSIVLKSVTGGIDDR